MTKLQANAAAIKEMKARHAAELKALLDERAEIQAERKQAIQAKKDAAEAKRQEREAAKIAKELERTRKLEERTAWMQAKLSRKGLTLAKWREEQIEAGRAH